MEWRWRGQTIGKRVLRLRVVDAQGLRLHFTQVVLRNLLRFVDMLPAHLDGRSRLPASPRGNAWVISLPTRSSFEPTNIRAQPRPTSRRQINSLREYPHWQRDCGSVFRPGK
jgi:hypothetical protein